MNQSKFPFALVYVGMAAGYFSLVRLFDIFSSHQGVMFDAYVAMFFAAHMAIGLYYFQRLLRKFFPGVHRTRENSTD